MFSQQSSPYRKQSTGGFHRLYSVFYNLFITCFEWMRDNQNPFLPAGTWRLILRSWVRLAYAPTMALAMRTRSLLEITPSLLKSATSFW